MKRVLGFTLIVVAAFWASTAMGQEDARSKTAEQDKAAIEKKIKSYVDAFNTGDAKRLAAHWSPDAVYVSRLDGKQITGSDNLEKEFAGVFKKLKGAKLAVITDSIEFISPSVALERGSATIVSADGETEKSTYRVVHVKRDGQWLIDRVTEEEEIASSSHYSQLKDLEWMIGDWVDEAGGAVVKTECSWTKNKNYLRRAFTVSVEGKVSMSGMQLVGWDPARKQIRSWVFDSDGGFAEGTWKRSGKKWLVRTSATLPDGTHGSSTSILEPIGEGRFTWQQVNRVVDGEILPSIDPVVVVRN